MLNSFTRHFNETVFRGPDNEGGSGDGLENVSDGGGDGGDAGGTDGADGGGEDESQKPLSVREQLKASIEEVRADEESKTKTPKKDAKTGKFQAAPKSGEALPEGGEVPPAVTSAAAPADLPPEAKAEWDKTPPAVQAAFIKRGQDMAAGVEQLKQRYNLIDQAIAPHNDALRQMNATPADAVNRMFLWFKALAGSPAQSFPALAKSMGIDWTKLVGPAAPAAGIAPAPAAGAEGAGGAPPVTEIPAPVKEYIGNLEQQLQQLSGVVNQIGGQFGNMQQSFQVQSEAKTRENLSIWAKDKPHFEEVRQDMAKLIETQVVPLKANGEVDLDTAYERAIYFNPEVRKKVLAEQQQADLAARQQTQDAATTAQQTQVGKARKAAVSLPASSTPGATQGNRAVVTKKPGQKTSVRDDLRLAIQQLREQ